MTHVWGGHSCPPPLVLGLILISGITVLPDQPQPQHRRTRVSALHCSISILPFRLIPFSCLARSGPGGNRAHRALRSRLQSRHSLPPEPAGLGMTTTAAEIAAKPNRERPASAAGRDNRGRAILAKPRTAPLATI